jgi:hypothetical protein
MSDGEGMLWISDPRGGASDNAGWHWRDGELVYTRKSRWVSVPHQDPRDRRGALLDEIRADFRHAGSARRAHRPLWRDLRAEIAEEFEQFTTREDDLTAAIDRRCSKVARQVAGRARAGRSPQKLRTVPCWVCRAPITTRASHRSYCSRKCKRKHYHHRGGAKVERAYMKRWRAKNVRNAQWRELERLRKRQANQRAERKQRKQQLERRPARPCLDCATPFVPLNAKRLYCTEVCRVRAAKRRYWRAHQSKLNSLRNARRQVAREERTAA